MSITTPLHVNINNISSFKKCYYPKREKNSEKVVVFNIFASIWCNRRQLEPHICFCVQSLMESHTT